jgi:hypothetical protein
LLERKSQTLFYLGRTLTNNRSLLFLISALVQLALARHHKKEKRFGPSPANNYTSGAGRGGFFGRGRKNKVAAHRDPEVAAGAGTLSTGPTHDVRPSHDTAYTGSTVAGAGTYEHNKPLVGGYHGAPATHSTPYAHSTPATNY